DDRIHTPQIDLLHAEPELHFLYVVAEPRGDHLGIPTVGQWKPEGLSAEVEQPRSQRFSMRFPPTTTTATHHIAMQFSRIGQHALGTLPEDPFQQAVHETARSRAAWKRMNAGRVRHGLDFCEPVCMKACQI